jgi:hypothetical protein
VGGDRDDHGLLYTAAHFACGNLVVFIVVPKGAHAATAKPTVLQASGENAVTWRQLGLNLLFVALAQHLCCSTSLRLLLRYTVSQLELLDCEDAQNRLRNKRVSMARLSKSRRLTGNGNGEELRVVATETRGQSSRPRRFLLWTNLAFFSVHCPRVLSASSMHRLTDYSSLPAITRVYVCVRRHRCM